MLWGRWEYDRKMMNASPAITPSQKRTMHFHEPFKCASARPKFGPGPGCTLDHHHHMPHRAYNEQYVGTKNSHDMTELISLTHKPYAPLSFAIRRVNLSTYVSIFLANLHCDDDEVSPIARAECQFMNTHRCNEIETGRVWRDSINDDKGKLMPGQPTVKNLYIQWNILNNQMFLSRSGIIAFSFSI